MSRSKQHQITFSGMWTEPHPAAYGCLYVNQRHYNEPRFCMQQALACLFAPSGMALAGKSAQEVEVAIAKAQSLFNTYMNDARQLVDAHEGRRPNGPIYGTPEVSNGHQEATVPVLVGVHVPDDDLMDFGSDELLNPEYEDD
ncbi:MAG: hypothetical protein ACFCU8_10485 [Thermosynechococcaceae cyanobacterium]